MDPYCSKRKFLKSCIDHPMSFVICNYLQLFNLFSICAPTPTYLCSNCTKLLVIPKHTTYFNVLFCPCCTLCLKCPLCLTSYPPREPLPIFRSQPSIFLSVKPLCYRQSYSLLYVPIVHCSATSFSD